MTAPLTYPPGERHDLYDAPQCGACGYPVNAEGKCDACADYFESDAFAGIPVSDDKPF